MRDKLILLELNEVPFRVIDEYCKREPRSTLARILPKCRQYETVTEDKLALDPWISWPTLHRGVNDEVHKILHLGQVLEETDEEFPPVWRILKEGGLAVGVFGSLHSSSVPHDVSDYSFYLPDYFASEAFAHPRGLLPFQELNLAMTRQSARNVTRKVPLAAAAGFLAGAPRLGLRVSTIWECLLHVGREMFDRSLRIRRRAYQPLVMGDLFLKQLERTRPDFSTFYTNHVAAAMHRYWGATFPQDYQHPLDAAWVRKYSEEIWFAMDKFDVILDQLVAFIDRNPEYRLLVASSMGQAAIPAERTDEFLTIVDVGKFMAALGVPAGQWQPRPAMVPCLGVVVADEYRDAVVDAMETLEVDGKRVVADKRPIAPMSYNERERGFFHLFVQFDNYRGPETASVRGRTSSLPDLGLGLMAHEDGVNCTAQHVLGGSLLVYGTGASAKAEEPRARISTLDVVPSILGLFELPRASYMAGAASIRLSH